MRRMVMVAFAVVAAWGAAGCAGRLGSPTPLPAPDSPAAQLFAAKCSGCHSAPHPRRHRYAEWQRIVEKMETHAGDILLTEAERTEILNYLHKYSRSSRFPGIRPWGDREKAHRWFD